MYHVAANMYCTTAAADNEPSGQQANGCLDAPNLYLAAEFVFVIFIFI